MNNLKALVVVLVLALGAFKIARPLALAYMPEAAFQRRCAIWLGLTTVAFLSPSFWIYAIVALVVLYREGRSDKNPLALYVLVTFTIPNVGSYVPAPLVNQLFELTQYRILSLAILLPAIYKPAASSGPRGSVMRPEDWLLGAFLMLQVVLLMPFESFTATLRRGFLFGLDTFVVFYAFSRIADRARVAEVVASFWIACMVMALVAIFESAKGWLLYTGLATTWGDPNQFAWLFRGDSLRAQGASGHSINLGYHMAIGLGFYLYLRNRSFSRWSDLAVIGILSVATYVSYSRGAWLTALLIAAVFVLLRPQAARRLLGPVVSCIVAIAILTMTPLHESVLDRLPFIGTVAQDTVEYRQRLAEVSWQLIRQNPWFGDPFVYLRMESLRQGQGIIDIVNGYVFATLFTGFVGLGLLVSVFAGSLIRGVRARWMVRRVDEDAGYLSAALVACAVGTLAFVATAGFGPTVYIVGALLIACATTMLPAAHAAGNSSSRAAPPEPLGALST